MHFWPNPSITKTLNAYNFKKIKANRPKGVADKDWNEIVAEEKLNKLIVLNKVLKASKKVEGKGAKA
jgi:hypothetical protein